MRCGDGGCATADHQHCTISTMVAAAARPPCADTLLRKTTTTAVVAVAIAVAALVNAKEREAFLKCQSSGTAAIFATNSPANANAAVVRRCAIVC